MKCFLTFVLLLVISCGTAQNLIENPGFENARKHDALSNFHNMVTAWTSPTYATPDLFATYHEMITKAPKNFCGSQMPHSGKRYAGIFAFGKNNYREYIQAHIPDTLEPNKPYRLTYYVSLAENSNRAIQNLGAMLTDTSFHTRDQKIITTHRLSKTKVKSIQFLTPVDTVFYKDTLQWIPVRFEFIATGKEHYLTIGNFHSNRNTTNITTVTDNIDALAYYYIDDVCLQPMFPPPASKRATIQDTLPKTTTAYALEKAYRLEKVLFEFNSTELSEAALAEIQQVEHYLETNPTLHISIEGHTDNVGTDAYNQQLSEDRARSVAEAFMALGLARERITFKGFGATQPVAENTTDEGRARNRRVQFRLSTADTK